MKSFRLDDDRATLRYHDIPGAGTPLLFIHGLGCASSCDYPTIAADPSLAGRRMLLVDLLGFGFSDRPADFSYTVDEHARTVSELARRLCPDAVDLFGHSMGGSIAIVAAGLLGGRVRHLIVSEPNFEPGEGEMSGRIAAMSERDYLAHGHGDLLRAERSDSGNIWATTWAASVAASLPQAMHRGATSLVVGSEPTWGAQLQAMTMPRTAIFGENSLPDRYADRLPDAGIRVEIVPDAGHVMAWENPAGVALAVRRGLEG